ncbi:hypothetical protein [Thalassospira sp.]|nr:hypothetical protein [Thalassospira sp.]
MSESRRRMFVAIGWSPEVLLNVAVGRIARFTLDALSGVGLVGTP